MASALLSAAFTSCFVARPATTDPLSNLPWSTIAGVLSPRDKPRAENHPKHGAGSCSVNHCLSCEVHLSSNVRTRAPL